MTTTQTSDCDKKAVATSRKRECLPCDVPPLCRNGYYRGKLLTERDFVDEQQYFVDKARLHNRMLHGWGVACGLEVKPHPHCPHLRVIVTPGYAIDCCGREIRVLRETQVELPRAEEKPEPPAPCPPEEEEKAIFSNGTSEPSCEELYLCIRYVECETEFSPAPFDDCSCSSDGQKPNRICEGYELKLLTERPRWWDEGSTSCHDEDDCQSLYADTLKGCGPHDCVPCIALAVIHDFCPERRVEPEQIDNLGPRRILPSVTVLDDVVECLLDHLPTENPTRIEDFNWKHGEKYHCHDFARTFVGTHDAPRGFEITFDSDVYARSIDARSFQAMVVHQPADTCEPRRIEIAPARVEATARSCTLYIDRGYAERHLEGRHFDLYITLRCNVITGRHGLPVDGNLLATYDEDDTYRVAGPTGDSIPGGDFVSWIRVRSGPGSGNHMHGGRS